MLLNQPRDLKIMNDTPEFFYKYRSVNHGDLENDRTLEALFKSYAIFSSRKNFNDPFDSKIILLTPSIIEFKDIVNHLNYKNPSTRLLPMKNMKELIDKNQKITSKGLGFIEGLIDTFNNMIDSYVFYSLSADINNILLWSHYAGSHAGFCIEFKSKFIEAQKVDYQSAVPSLKITDLLPIGDKDKDRQIGEKIQKALLVKLDSWEYENEYRFNLSDKVKSEPLPDYNKKVAYTEDFVESIIFGSRMPQETKDYIIKNMPYKVIFKQAVELDSSIEIRPYMP
jgi:hypothetical protein